MTELLQLSMWVDAGAEAAVTSGGGWWRNTGSDPKEPEDMELRVGGLVSRTHTFIDWTHRRLKEGDEIKIVITDKPKVSKPKKARTESAVDRKKRKMASLKVLSQELGYAIKKSPTEQNMASNSNS